jgi:hypothetical protein
MRGYQEYLYLRVRLKWTTVFILLGILIGGLFGATILNRIDWNGLILRLFQ